MFGSLSEKKKAGDFFYTTVETSQSKARKKKGGPYARLKNQLFFVMLNNKAFWFQNINNGEFESMDNVKGALNGCHLM